jgi:hypothetical protein
VEGAQAVSTIIITIRTDILLKTNVRAGIFPSLIQNEIDLNRGNLSHLVISL